MANDRYIDIVINKDGTVEAEAFGYKGKGCADDISEIMRGLGNKVKSKKKTDYFDKQKVRTNQHH
jgi:hypothetical protein